jgi:hypothetical protein
MMSGDRTRILLLVVVGLVIITGIIVIPSLPFSWGVDQGDELVYNVVFVRTIPQSWAHLPERPYPSINSFNNSQITVTIDHLPLIVLTLNDATFTTIIVSPDKITCTLENGTEVDDEAFNLLSNCILPIGGWNLIDSYFPNNTESYQEKPFDTYFSEIGSEFFLFGYRKMISDDTTISWSGYIDMNTGIPVNVTQRFFDLCYTDEIFLTRIDT